jgi:hypothetical protein
MPHSTHTTGADGVEELIQYDNITEPNTSAASIVMDAHNDAHLVVSSSTKVTLASGSPMRRYSRSVIGHNTSSSSNSNDNSSAMLFPPDHDFLSK